MYLYPQFPGIAVKAAVCAYKPIYRAIHGHALSQDLSGPPDVYDRLEPFEVLLIARTLSVVLGVTVVLLSGLFAKRLAGSSAGLVAALTAALVPALVLRGSIATVDSYATCLVLACMIFTERSRSSARPGVASFAAGAMAGFAFASKYPAVVVLAAFLVTTLLEPLGMREKGRRTALAGVGLVAGAVLAMPALVWHWREVVGAIRYQSVLYAQIKSPSLARQIFLSAEPNVRYDRAELGFIFVAFTAAGLVLGLSSARLRPVFCGWLAFAGLALVIYSHQLYQPFRNLMPLVPPACIAVAVAFVDLRRRTKRPHWADMVGLLWVVVFLGVPLANYCRRRMELVDSRVEAMDWLATHVRNGDSSLIVRDLGFLNQELARLNPRPTVRWWEETASGIDELHPVFLVAGILMQEDGKPVDVAKLQPVLTGYVLRARYGEQPTVPIKGWWHGNRQVIYILERRPQASGPKTPSRLDRSELSSAKSTRRS